MLLCFTGMAMLAFEKLEELREKGEVTQEDIDKFLIALGLLTGLITIKRNKKGKIYITLAKNEDFRSIKTDWVTKGGIIRDATMALARLIALRRGKKRGFTKEDMELAKKLLGVEEKKKKEILKEEQRKKLIERFRELAPYIFS